VVQADLVFGNCLTNEVMTDVNVLRTRMTNVVLDMVKSSLRVGENRDGMRDETSEMEIVDLLAEHLTERGFFAGFGQRHILIFHRGYRDDALFAGIPDDGPAVHKAYVSDRGSCIIRVRGVRTVNIARNLTDSG
jgi:hypothetical protein